MSGTKAATLPTLDQLPPLFNVHLSRCPIVWKELPDGTKEVVCWRSSSSAVVTNAPTEGSLRTDGVDEGSSTSLVANTQEVDGKGAISDKLNGEAKELMKKKDDLSHWYLNLIETAVDSFLAGEPIDVASGGVLDTKAGAHSLGYTPDAIPFNYLDEAPKDLNAIARNLDVLSYLSSEVYNPGSLLRRLLLDPVVKTVWSTGLTPLKESLVQFLNSSEVIEELARIAAEKEEKRREQEKETGAKKRIPLSNVEKVKADLEYVQKIEELEKNQWSHDESPQKNTNNNEPQGVSDIVPIGGLLMSKLHRLENEHRTVLQHWQRGN